MTFFVYYLPLYYDFNWHKALLSWDCTHVYIGIYWRMIYMAGKSIAEIRGT
jgi:hypothetical protein